MQPHWVNSGTSSGGFDWLGGETVNTLPNSPTLVEAPIGEPNFKSIWWLEEALTAAKRVMRVKLPGGAASGFMIAADIMITNHHVFENADDAARAILQFNYRLTASGSPVHVDEWECDPDSLFEANPSLDYSICRVRHKDGIKAGDEWGYFDLRHGVNSVVNQRVNIIQHPRGRFKEIAFRDNQIKRIDETIVQYLTDTDYGSSGSPVLDWFNVVALHSQRVADPNQPTKYYRNQGFNINAILDDTSSIP